MREIPMRRGAKVGEEEEEVVEDEGEGEGEEEDGDEGQHMVTIQKRTRGSSH
jgi:hypothetical protein